jgi:NAD(P)-dependent dehydrogenase (short-subunit alcohol dehydrogenase family)
MKTLVVTGVTSGVGLEIVRRFVALGDRVIGLGRDGARLEAITRELGSERFWARQVDVRMSSEVQRVFDGLKDQVERIDVLVNNAAVFKTAPFESFTIEDIDAIIDTNLKGTIYCTHQALPFLRRGSRIVNMGSVSGTHGIENQAAYSSSKFGVEGFAESLGQELSKRGIHITTICPGGIATPLWNEKNPYGGDVNVLLRCEDIVALVEHVAGLPERVVFKKAILFPSNEWH